ncbi:hypothetical protein C6988_03685 [Nitrosopumilus sp. b1]|uniref:SemiSWEET family sugar transporter n=1 Tax=Nitrosopumilus sp. b1 TaxID=2109907 RepID=UPI0015F53912|nr:SemiSWEET family transporter [Nitrosopumilus sp. b1]KAF6243355.1 hypothetical protein C6988_03685 [Nitrosopumilus sp. b1]
MFLDDFSLTIIVIAAGVLILSGWVEQIIRGYRTKSLKDVSPYLMILIAIGALLWLIYGIEILDPYIIGTNIAAIILMIIIFGLKRRYDRKKSL